MDNNLNKLFNDIRIYVFNTIRQKNIDIDCLAFDLRVDREEFINNFTHRIDNFGFYLQAILLVNNWEG